MSSYKYSKSSKEELELRKSFLTLFQDHPLQVELEILSNFSLFMNKMSLSRLLFFNELYKKILGLQGVIIEFGVYWGRDMTLLQNLRSIYEPFNLTRKVIGFDTFEGLKGCLKEIDGDQGKDGDFKTPKDYDKYLDLILQYHEKEAPIPHIKKYELIKGDVRETLPRYLQEHQETIIALVYFDMDIYAPTKTCLEAIKPYLQKGSIIAFDELNYDRFPGETLAVKEILGLRNIKLQRIEHEPVPCYVVIE